MVAHSDGENPPHLLRDHLLAVAELAASKAAGIEGGEPWARIAGRWHDLGKYRPGFQKYVRHAKADDAHIEGRVPGRDKTHSAAGALWAKKTLKDKFGANGELASRVLAYLIASHHAGLYDWNGGLDERLNETDSLTEMQEALAACPPNEITAIGNFVPDLRNIPGGSAGFSLWVRMLFSCLVDADFLDTEEFFDAGKVHARKGFPTLDAMHAAFDAYMEAKALQAKLSDVNTHRADILRQCRDRATLTPGFFSLTVPTGGGKTLSSLAFAMTHATRSNQCADKRMRRIIYAIPYTSIIEQTADVFREALKTLGDEVLIEHHSQADADEKDETARSRLACENWDAPLIVTTNVQLFESLFAAKTSRCRKLHNIVNSVIVLDEAQQLPPDFLQPILDVLNLLVKHYGVTVVLCTATQPALASTEYFDASRNLRGLENVREIIDDPDALCTKLKRVNVELPTDWQTSMSWPQVAETLTAEGCVLAIVSTRKAARELHGLMPPGTLHLSALMCGAHRSAVIEEIKIRLQSKREGSDAKPLRVISTQVVDAGVDLDFPVVWRALAGLDSIAQAAGRCNREGLIAGGGRVVVFVPPDAPPRGLLRKAASACISVLHEQETEPLTRDLFEAYFRQLYHSVDLDAKGVVPLLTQDTQELKVQFRSAACAFQLIDDEGKTPVIVKYKNEIDTRNTLLGKLENEGPKRWLMRKLQRFSVNIHKREADVLLECGSLSLVMPGLYVQEADDLYDDTLGWLGDDNRFNPSRNVI